MHLQPHILIWFTQASQWANCEFFIKGNYVASYIYAVYSHMVISVPSAKIPMHVAKYRLPVHNTIVLCLACKLHTQEYQSMQARYMLFVKHMRVLI